MQFYYAHLFFNYVHIKNSFYIVHKYIYRMPQSLGVCSGTRNYRRAEGTGLKPVVVLWILTQIVLPVVVIISQTLLYSW